MKTRRFDFVFTPLQLDHSVEQIGSVPSEQTYDADTGEYSPDYSLTPHVIKPSVGIIDRDGILESGNVNAQLTDLAWYQVIDGIEQTTPLTSTPNKYAITTYGDDAGKLMWYVNAAPQKPIVLHFHAKFLDTRTNQVFNIYEEHTIICRNATLYKPVLLLNSGDRFYNPLRDPDKQVIKASLRLGTKECETGKRQFVWEILRKTGYFTPVTADDLEVAISADGASITVDRSLMGTGITLRCRAKYSATGNPSAVQLSDASPYKTVSLARRIPSFDYDWQGIPDNIDPKTTKLYPTVSVSDNAGEIVNPSKNLQFLWYTSPNLSIDIQDQRLVAHGETPTIPTDRFDPTRGGILTLDAKILAPLALAIDTDGKVFVDADGKPFVWH